MATILFKSKKLRKLKETKKGSEKTKEDLEKTKEEKLKKKIFNFSNITKYLILKNNIMFIFSRISGMRQNYWPDIRRNQYPVQP